MKKNVCGVIFVHLGLFTMFACRPKDTPASEGAYLGQTPPGDSPALFAPGLVSTGCHEMDIAISPDGNEIYFTRSGPDWTSAVLLCTRGKNGWTGPEMAPFSGRISTNYPFLSPDGKRLYFDSREESADPMNRDIFVVLRDGESWSSPRALPSSVNTSAPEGFCSVAASGNLYFGSRREGGIGGADIYTARRSGTGFLDAENLGESVNSPYGDFHPFIDSDERFIIFDSQRPGGFGANDLYISFRQPDGTWSEAVNMGESVNTPYADMRPYVSPDGKYVFFCSNRPNPQYGDAERPLSYEEFMLRIDGPGLGSQDIYWMDAAAVEHLP